MRHVTNKPPAPESCESSHQSQIMQRAGKRKNVKYEHSKEVLEQKMKILQKKLELQESKLGNVLTCVTYSLPRSFLGKCSAREKEWTVG